MKSVCVCVSVSDGEQEKGCALGKERRRKKRREEMGSVRLFVVGD